MTEQDGTDSGEGARSTPLAPRIVTLFGHLCLGLLPILGIAWIIDIPIYLGIPIVPATVVSVALGLAIAGGLILQPFGSRAGWVEVFLGIVAIACWSWLAWNYEDWLLSTHERGPEKWIPGIVGLALLAEATRRNCGNALFGVVGILVLYAFFGSSLPGPLAATEMAPSRILLYLYTDPNAVPGIVLIIALSLVLAFVLLGQVMSASGATAFFTDLAMAWMGHRRGGPAKVGIVASSVFGSINGSTVANIMTTGILTIPLMKRTGFPAPAAAAVEAVASTGGQLAPPVMGATAFLIAQFLEIPYTDVVIAAILPAAIYYLTLLIKIDLFAARHNLQGLPKDQLPKVGETLRRGWLHVPPLVALIYLLFGVGLNPGKSALIAAVVALLPALLGRQQVLTALAREITVEAGRSLTPLMLIAGAAGIVIGVMNVSGLGFNLSQALTNVGQTAGLLALLIITALISIVLGMGMPSTAVYLVLSVLLASAMINLGVVAIAAHMFIFYFGLMSGLTPPVAVASYVSASLAKANMWETSWFGLRFGASAYLIPFVFAFNPALLANGTAFEIAVVIVSMIASSALLAISLTGKEHPTIASRLLQCVVFAFGVAVGTSTIWLGSTSIAVLAGSILLIVFLLMRARPKQRLSSPTSEKLH